MPFYNATATLASETGDTADVQVNGFAIVTTSAPTNTELEGWSSVIQAFYDDLEVAGWLKGRAQNGHLVKIYATDTGVPNYPILEESFNLTSAPGGIDLPNEVSLCISYANDSSNSVPRARRRGRIYISGATEAANVSGRPTSGVIGAIADIFEDYVQAVNSTANLEAGIWSRTNATVYPIERIWVDNEWDTMRSRGGKPTERATRTI
jgi:hypothetical protein